MSKHSLAARLRIFRIWQRTGEKPFSKNSDSLPAVECSSCGHMVSTPFCPNCGQPYRSSGSFFKGTFDSIPFLNDDAKRTFVHLLLRPGYMILDYLKGKSSRYMSPMMALIIFYAFYALAASIISPDMPNATSDNPYIINDSIGKLDLNINGKYDTVDISGSLETLNNIFILTRLDRFPQYADTPAKASLAAFESSLRSQGIYLFLWKLIMLTLSIWLVFGIGRKRKLSFSASATVSAYFLCQYCFAMLIVLFCTWEKQEGLGYLVMAIIMAFDFHQLFQFSIWKSIRKVIGVSLVSLLLITGIIVLLVLILMAKYGVF